MSQHFTPVQAAQFEDLRFAGLPIRMIAPLMGLTYWQAQHRAPLKPAMSTIRLGARERRAARIKANIEAYPSVSLFSSMEKAA